MTYAIDFRIDILVKLTDDGIKKTDELIEVIKNWENQVTARISDDELETLKGILFKMIINE